MTTETLNGTGGIPLSVLVTNKPLTEVNNPQVDDEITKLNFDIPSKIGTTEGDYLIQKQLTIAVKDLIAILKSGQTPSFDKIKNYTRIASLAGHTELRDLLLSQKNTISLDQDKLEKFLLSIENKEQELGKKALAEKKMHAEYALRQAILQAKQLGIKV